MARTKRQKPVETAQLIVVQREGVANVMRAISGASSVEEHAVLDEFIDIFLEELAKTTITDNEILEALVTAGITREKARQIAADLNAKAKAAKTKTSGTERTRETRRSVPARTARGAGTRSRRRSLGAAE